MKRRSALLLITLTAIAVATLYLTLLPQPPPPETEHRLIHEDNPLLTLDDFSTDPSERWILLKDARWKPEEQNLLLASIRPGDTGAVWLKKTTTQPFTVEFTYYVGDGNGGNGFVFMFYKDTDYDPGAGRYIGFACRPEQDRPCPREDVPGYGVEWDTLYNNGYGLGDPSSSHIALIQDNVNNHLTYVNDTTTKDNRWHRAKIIVKEDSLEVYVDQKRVLTWRGIFNRTHSHFGFGASSYVHYDNHRIDDFKIYGNTLTITGLQPRWNIELHQGDRLLAQATVPDDGERATTDTTHLDTPLRASITITDEAGSTIFETPNPLEIWGGDTYRLETATP